jgi:hypothetical protein
MRKHAKDLPSIDKLRELVSCDFNSGDVFWNHRPASMFEGKAYPAERLVKTWNAKYAGKLAGSPNGTGHLRAAIGDRRIVLHWVVWALYYGEWPEDGMEIDHKNLDGTDNRISNLRIATRSQNGHNKTPPSNNASGVKGVSWHKQGKKWQVKFGFGGKQYHLGLFSDFDRAVKVRQEKINSLLGEFAREN